MFGNLIPDSCPQCGHEPVTEVVYGLIRSISPTLRQELQSTRKKLGGCVIRAQAPAYGCLACDWTVTREDAAAHHADAEAGGSHAEGD